ncbi:hypothetical protein QAD02_014839 [Eretmocerus hayati]|uniref:Uncharacterized protein n=1 Tax=Eretmocerus hayati TaxID=131215 RepID=A0ACC2P6K3_9HYME|nr:hypothetical protein QAD02_014839 [Eretmocerus hayati]
MSTKTKSSDDEKLGSKSKLKNVSSDGSSASSIVLEDEACKQPEKPAPRIKRVPGNDPRFQQINQTTRCFVMYVDFHHCENILGKGHEACTWFQDVYKCVCPNEWIERWDGYVEEGRMFWHKKADFAKGPYGKVE